VREVVVIGGMNLDVKARSADRLIAGTSNPGSTLLTPGGVGRNVAENLARLGTPTRLVSAVGDDPLGDLVVTATRDAGVDVTGVRRLPGRTASYTAVLDSDGELVAGVADMTAADAIVPALLEPDSFRDAAIVVLDGNLPLPTLDAAMSIAAASGIPVALDPVSVPKAERLAGPLGSHPVFVVTPSRDELSALGGKQALLDRQVEIVWVRLGVEGSVLCTEDGETELAAARADVVDVTGAGDAMLAGFVHAHLCGATPVDAAAYGHAVAALTVASPHTVRPDLSDVLVKGLL
jgi:pseudouridine kinase